MRSRPFPAGRRSLGIHGQRGWAWLAPAVTAAVGVLSGDKARRQMHEQMDMQREFAQNGLQWKADDARRAGLHPLAALGASGYTASPVSVGSTGYESLSGLGQDISRALLANSDQEGRDAYLRKETSQFDARMRSNAAAMSDIELEAARLRLNRLQNEVTAQAQGYDIQPAQITASNPLLPSVAAGPAGPGFRTTRIGNSSWDIGSSELSEWAEGAGLAGHGLVPFWMYQQALARSNMEKNATDDAHRGKDTAYTLAAAEARRTGGTVERHRDRDGHWGWAVIPKSRSIWTDQERSYWGSRRLFNIHRN